MKTSSQTAKKGRCMKNAAPFLIFKIGWDYS